MYNGAVTIAEMLQFLMALQQLRLSDAAFSPRGAGRQASFPGEFMWDSWRVKWH
jgi:hypothetical protein